MVKLRLARHGRTHKPFFRLNAYDVRTRRNGKVIEALGWYNPIPGQGEKDLELKADRIKHWLEHGAQPTDTVRDLLGNQDLLPPKMKAKWEADRAADRQRVTCRTSLKKVEAASEELGKLAESAEHPEAVNPFVATAAQALKAVQLATGKADVAAAEQAAADAEQALADAQAAEAAAKQAEAKKKAEEEAAAAAAAAAESESAGAEGDSAEGDGEAADS